MKKLKEVIFNNIDGLVISDVLIRFENNNFILFFYVHLNRDAKGTGTGEPGSLGKIWRTFLKGYVKM